MLAHINKKESPSEELKALEPEELGRIFDRLHCLASDRVFEHMSRSMHDVDLSFSQLSTIVRLYKRGPLRIGELARGAHLSHCATSRLVARLEKSGLVQKKQNPENKRERLVSLTGQGYSYFENLQRYTALAYDELFSELPGTLKDELVSVLGKIDPHLNGGAPAK